MIGITTIEIIKKPRRNASVTPRETIRRPITEHKQIFEVNSNGNLTNAPHNPPHLITEITRAMDAINVRTIATGRIHLTHRSRLSENEE